MQRAGVKPDVRAFDEQAHDAPPVRREDRVVDLAETLETLGYGAVLLGLGLLGSEDPEADELADFEHGRRLDRGNLVVVLGVDDLDVHGLGGGGLGGDVVGHGGDAVAHGGDGIAHLGGSVGDSV